MMCSPCCFTSSAKCITPALPPGPAAATLDDPALVATVFAPNNDGIARTLRDGGASEEQLLANPQLLSSILAYHVVPGRTFQVREWVATTCARC